MQITGLKGARLSFQQERLWTFLQENTAFRVQNAIWMRGTLCESLFLQKVQQVVDRHEILHTVFHTLPGMDVPVQVIGQRPLIFCPLIDLAGLHPALQRPLLDTSFDVLQTQPFDLVHGPLLRTVLFRLSPEKHLFLISASALCADAATLPLFMSELFRLYESDLTEQWVDQEPLQYTAVSAWQHELLESEEAEEALDFWQHCDLQQATQPSLPFSVMGGRGLAPLPPMTNVGPDGQIDAPSVMGGKGSRCWGQMKAAPLLPFARRTIVIDDMTRIQTIAEHFHVSPEALLCACWQIALLRLTNDTELVMGVACDGRDDEELADVLGPCTRYVPCDLSFGKYWTFAQALSSIHHYLQRASTWQHYFTWPVSEHNTDTVGMRNYFPVAFSYQHWSACVPSGSIALTLYRSAGSTEPFVLKLHALQIAEQLQLELHYDPDFISEAHVTRLSSVFQTLLTHALDQPHAHISALHLVSLDEQRHLRKQFCGPCKPLSADAWHHLFEAQARQRPQQAAVLDNVKQLTYGELNSQANQLAHVLQRFGVAPNVVVGLCLSRSVEMIVAMLAIFKAGGGYLPIDPENPPARLAYQLNDAQIPLLLTSQALVSRVPRWNGQTLAIETLQRNAAQEDSHNLTVSSSPADIAYVIYTSGSTGVPKGVIVQQRGVVNYTHALCELLHAEPGWSFATVSTLAADLGNTAIFCALASGGCLHIPNYDTVTSAEALRHWSTRTPIDVLKIVPSHLAALLRDEHAAGILPCRALVLGGEALPLGLLQRIQALGGSCDVYNHYGPTEATIGVLVNKVDMSKCPTTESQLAGVARIVPLGRPIHNIEVYVLDEQLRIVPVGVTGELYIGGVGLASGYLHQQEQTAGRFLPHPFAEQPGARLYRTGDQARYGEQGQIEFVGRADSQVKLRGYRIELGEIEAALRQHPNVWDCAVVLWADGDTAPQLVAYVVALKQPDPSFQELGEFLRGSLPGYMIPSISIPLKVLPLTANGKLDRRQLPTPEVQQHTATHTLALPRSPIEELLLDIWQELLALPEISINDNFFQRGGHSLLATQAISRVQAVMHVELPIQSLFEAPTIAEFSQRVGQALSGQPEHNSLPLTAMPRTAHAPLSFAQERLWFLEQLEPGSTTYLIPRALRICGALDTLALERSLHEILRRHENLRTTFEARGGQPVQIIHPSGMFRLPVVDLREFAEQQRVKEARRLTRQDAEYPCNLAQGPLLRLCLLALTNQEYVLLFTMHHIISDDWSNAVFVRELTTLYSAFSTGQATSLAPLPLQYTDFALWQRQWLQEKLAPQREYWKRHLADVPVLALPTDHARPPLQTSRGSYQSVWLPSVLQAQLSALSQREHVTLFMLLLSAFQVLLARYSGQDDISVGTPIANRAHIKLEGLIGFFVNTLVMRADLSGNPTFLALLDRVRKVALEAYAHQDIPFERLVEALHPARDLSRSPLFQVMFVMQQAARSVETRENDPLAGLLISEFSTEHRISKFDLSLYVVNEVHGLYCGIEYNVDLFEAATIQRLLGHWHRLLEGIVEAPATTLADLPLLTNAERQQLLIDWNATQTQNPQEQDLCQLLEAQVLRSPESIALVFEEQQLTYQELNRRANQLAHYLHTLGVGLVPLLPGSETKVGLCLHRSPETIISLLAVLKAGGAYVPLDPAYPPERLRYLIEDSRLALLLTQPEVRPRLPNNLVPLISLESLWQDRDVLAVTPVDHRPLSGQLAYLIYTSGSTGQPKGCMITHQALAQRVQALMALFDLHPGHRQAQLVSLSFDVFGEEVFPALCSGATVVVLPSPREYAITDMMQLCDRLAITKIELPTSYWRQTAEELAREGRQAPSSLSLLVTGGESPSVETLQQWSYLIQQPMRVFNLYGPTETTILATSYAIEISGAQAEIWQEKIPLGRPLAGTQAYVLDQHGQTVPLGVPGELYLGGSGLARGYCGRAELTAERFVPHPFSQQPGARLYRSGDLVRYRRDGDLEFVGRVDQQIKLHGYRIELGEIENTLKEHPFVRDAVVVLKEDHRNDRHLVAYIVGTPLARALDSTSVVGAPLDSTSKTLSTDILRPYLQEKLPAYMAPAFIVLLDTLPLTPAGKIDRKALPEPEFGQYGWREGQVAPRTLIEALLAEIWCEVLKRPPTGVHDNFFESGGHSLLATQLASRLCQVFQVEVPLRSLFEAPTIAGLAQRLEQILQGPSKITVAPLVRAGRDQDLPLSFAQQRLWFLYQLEPESTAYLVPHALRLRGTLDIRSLERSLSEIVRRHEILRTTFPFHAGQPLQSIHPAGTYSLPVMNVRGLEAEAREREALRLAKQEAEYPCDIARGPLLRVSLLQLDEQEYALLLTMHHIITDGWSMGVFLRELVTLYHAFLAGKPLSLSPLPVQYADFAIWQRHWLQGDVLETQLAYWRQQLAGIAPLDFPTDHPRPTVKTYHGAFQSRTLPAQVRNELLSLSQREGVTLFMLLLAAFQALLARSTGQDDISVGTPIANRTRPELEKLIGFFVNTLVLRSDVSHNPSFIELLRRVREVTVGAYTHQDIPFEYLVEALHPERDLSRTPLFQVMFTMQQTMEMEPVQQELQEFVVSGLGTEHNTTKFDLTFFVQHDSQTLQCGIEYNTDLFESDTIQRLLEHWQILLEGIITAPHARLSDVPLLNAEERRLFLETSTVAREAMPQQSIQERFEQQVRIRPEAIALQYEEQQITYSLLNRQANQLAHSLRRQGVGADAIVGVCLERSLDLVLALLGILKAGGAYLPLDPSSPAKRIAFMLHDTRARLVLTQQALLSHVPAQGVPALCLDDAAASLAGEQQHLENPTSAERLAYVIYTSGSTGTPKGVMVSHANVVRLFAATENDFHFSEQDTWTLFHSSAFDFSVWELWGALSYGGRLLVVSYEVSRSPESFSTLLLTHGVTVLNQTPSAFRQLVQVHLGSGHETALALRWIIFGGEALDAPSVLTWFERYGEQRPQLVNMYGITETTVHVTFRPLRLHDVQHVTGSQIGHPLPDLRVYVLDRFLQPVPIGVAGEMYVAGAGVARGYLHQPALTSERFLPHPFSGQPGARLYKTGDKARFLPSGELEYLGRVDQQVKLRGFRIELGEIETQLERHPAIQSCVVIMREDGPGDKRLVAYVVAYPGAAPTSSELRRSLLETLPEYMTPSTFVLLETWPLTTGGKVDRRALPMPDQNRPALEETYEPPRTPTEEILAMIWASVLGVALVGIHDNFFALGGDSIRSITVLAQARKLGIHFSLQQLFLHQTIYKLSQALGEEGLRKLKADQVQPGSLIAPEDWQRLPADVEDAYPMAKLQAGMLFHSQYDPGSAIYNDIISHYLRAPLDLQYMRMALQYMVRQHPILRTSFDVGSFSEPLQLVHREAEIPLQVDDLRAYSYEDQEAMLDAWIEDVKKHHPFDWTLAPLVRIHIHMRSEHTFQFTLNCHHAILDGWSVAVLLTGFFKLYLRLVEGKELPAEVPLAAHYRDFIAIEQRLLMSSEAQQYWVYALDGSTRITFPRWPTSDEKTEHASFYDLQIPITPQTSENLSRLARELAVPIKSVLLAAHLKVLSVMCGETDVLIGLVYNGRPEIADGERLLGVFVNTLPLRLKLAGGTWADLVKDCFTAECELLPYRWYPLAEIQRQSGEHELFKTYFDFMHFHEYRGLSDAENIDSLGHKGFAASEFALAANFSQDLFSSQISLAVTCNLDDLCPEQIELLAGYYTSALNALANEPHTHYHQHSLLSAKELQHMLVAWNATQVERPAGKYLHTFIEDQAAKTPDAIAIVCADEQLTYAAFNRQANQLAHHLQRLGVGPECVVGVCMPRSLEMVVGLLGIFKAGGAYMPMDPSYPPERLAFMLTNAHVSVLLTQQHIREKLPVYRGHEVCLDTNWQTLSQECQTPPVCDVTADNLAYVIYTSGSTGQPKGAMVTQRGMLNHLFAKIQTLDLNASDRVAQTASHCFDISVWQFFAALMQGGQVCIYPDEIARDPLQLFEQAAVEHISILEVVPSLLRAFLDAIDVGATLAVALHWLVVTGEMCSATIAMRWIQRFSQVSLLNAYGPTECSDDVTHAVLNHTTLAKVANAPIGQPINNTQIYILDSALQPLPVGVPGQMYVGGLGVGRGYMGNTALTASVFVPDPFGQPGGRLYKTGDIGRYHPDGQIEFIQRIDHQVKMHGYRIELGEIEVVLAQHTAVRESLVMVREDTPGEQQLVAYIVLQVGAQFIAPNEGWRNELRPYLQQRLPDFMLPQTFVLLDAFPLTTNGKINRQALPVPVGTEFIASNEGSTALAAPRTPVEELLVGIWCEVLGRSQVSTQDDFFELGGDSLLAIRLISRVQLRLQTQLPLRSLFEAPTIVGLAQQIDQILRKGQNLELPPLRAVARQQDLPLSFAQQRLWFLDQLEPGSTAYLIPNVHRFQGPLDVQVLERSLAEVIRRHESLRTTFQVRDDQPVQVIHPATLFRLPVVDLSRLGLEIRESEARRLIEQEAQHPCDLTRGPLLRTLLVRLHCDEQALLWTMHHIISDRWSMQVFEREMVTLYQAFASGQPSPLLPMPIQYADFAFLQRQWLQGDVLEAQLDYWIAQLSGAPTLELPIDHPRPPVQSRRGAAHLFILSGELSQALITLSHQEGVTLFMLLLAAFQVLLYRYTSQRDFVLGTNSANRNRVEVEGIIGFFINLLALRANVSGNPSFREVLRRVREVVLGAYAHQETPFELLVEKLAPTRTLDRMPLVQALFVLQNFTPLQSAPAEMTDLTERDMILDPLRAEAATARFDLALFMAEHTGQLFGALNYSLDLFEASTIASMAERLKTLLHSIVLNPDQAIDRFEFLTDQERLQHEQEIQTIKSTLRLRKGERFTLPG